MVSGRKGLISMKRVLVFFVAIGALGGCATPDFQKHELSDRQLKLIAKLQAYELPSQSVPSTEVADQLLAAATSAAFRIALEMGLTADASAAGDGIVIVGKKVEERQMVLAVQFYVAPDGRVAFEETYRWKGIDMSAGSAMREKYLSILVH